MSSRGPCPFTPVTLTHTYTVTLSTTIAAAPPPTGLVFEDRLVQAELHRQQGNARLGAGDLVAAERLYQVGLTYVTEDLLAEVASLSDRHYEKAVQQKAPLHANLAAVALKRAREVTTTEKTDQLVVGGGICHVPTYSFTLHHSTGIVVTGQPPSPPPVPSPTCPCRSSLSFPSTICQSSLRRSSASSSLSTPSLPTPTLHSRRFSATSRYCRQLP